MTDVETSGRTLGRVPDGTVYVAGEDDFLYAVHP